MSIDDEDVDLYNSFSGGCDLHGDQYMLECGMCGTEFCSRCHPGSSVCPDCAEMADDDEDSREPDFEDVDSLDALGFEDNEADQLAKEGDDFDDI